MGDGFLDEIEEQKRINAAACAEQGVTVAEKHRAVLEFHRQQEEMALNGAANIPNAAAMDIKDGKITIRLLDPSSPKTPDPS
ncbi:MAG: hypothetical protein DHS20C02_03610 [Micavibrio sp.]|nr:MAG: hypothetical protein DHS20C02_03610 [Micavibrio sp.]